jgi:lipopolysaccharide biosynthesis glycosyltransferase
MNEKCNGVIIYLSRKQDFNDLKKSIQLLYKFFNKKYNYPIIIFHDDFSQEDMQYFIERYPNLKFKSIKFEIPSWINKDKIAPGSIGYKHMCRFFAGELFKNDIIKKYEWYWRLDSDSFIHSKIKYDIFNFFDTNNYVYGYVGEKLNISYLILE